MVRTDVLVIGAGQAGLSAAYHLAHSGTDHLVLDAESGPGGAWRHRWPSLTMAGVNGIRELPASVVPDVDSAVPARVAVPDYFAGYEQQFALNVCRPVTVRRVVEDGTRLVAATGSWNRPFWPWYPGRDDFAGWQLHTHDYPGADRFAGRRVVVIGGGISAVQLLMEIAPVAAEHRLVTRRPPVWVDREFTSELGRAAVASIAANIGNRCSTSASRASRIAGVSGSPVTETTDRGGRPRRTRSSTIAGGVSWPDGSRFDADILFWCTGFRAALDHLTPLRLRGAGGGIAMDGTRTVADPRVYLVGYGPSASTIGASGAGRVAVREIHGMLGLADGPGRGSGRHSAVE